MIIGRSRGWDAIPVDVTTMLVGLHVACAILTALIFAVGTAGP